MARTTRTTPGCTGRIAAGVACLALMALGGCSINPPMDLAEQAPAPIGAAEVEAPFYPQTEQQCGPAALAGVLGASGVETTPEALSPQVFLPGREGSLQMELVAATRRAGRVPWQVEGTMEGLLAELSAGRPVLVLQNLGTPGFPRWHYAVLTGFHAADNEVLLNSGKREGKRQSARSFARTWNWAGNWALVALRPGELPARPEPLPFAESVAAFERLNGFAAAEPAWQAMVRRWPEDWRPWLAFGNAAYQQGDHPSAIAHYRRGLALAPGSPVLENNLATVLAESGCPHAAEARLRPVFERLGTDSPWRGDLEATLHELDLFRQPDEPHCAETS